VYDGRDDFNANIATFGDSLSNDPSGGRVEFGWGNAVFGTTLTHTMVGEKLDWFLWLAVRRQHDVRTARLRLEFFTLLDLARGLSPSRIRWAIAGSPAA